MSDEAARISAQRMRMLELHPFWGYLLMQVRILPDPTLPAIAATDCVRHIWYHPERVRALDADQLGFVLAHEVGHAVYATLDRARGRDPLRWNQATDYAINRIVANLPHPSGRGPLYRPIPGILLDRRFDGLVAEGIYERLAEEERTGAAVRVQVDGRPAIDHGGGLDVHVPAGLDPDAADALADRMRAALAYAEGQAARGDVPGEVARAFGAARAQVPWQRVFRRLVATARTTDEYDPRRPHRRWAAQGFVVPSRAGERVGTVVVALDTSGSMGADALAAACAEIRALAREVEDLRLVVADARVQEVVALDGLEAWLARGRAKGGGGTDHRPVFAWLARSGVVPDVLVGITDLWSVFPERAPGFPVVWVVPERHGEARFGQVVVAR